MELKCQEILSQIKTSLANNDLDRVKELLADVHPADIGEILEELIDLEKIRILKLLPRETAAEVLNELDKEKVPALLDALGSEHISEILQELSTDDAADILGDLPEEEKDKYLDLMEFSDAEDVQELMEYGEETAGGIMTTDYVAIRKDITAERAIQVLREIGPDAETVYYVYVINELNQLVGVISLRELIIADPNSLIEDIMRTKVKSVNVNTDQEEVAKIVSKYDFLAIPVVNDNGQLLGIITHDDVSDVIQEEATEDIYRLAGISEVEDSEDMYKRLRTSVKSRLPWLVVTLMGSLFSAQVLDAFESKIKMVVGAIIFIPMLMGLGGNVGTQSSTLIVRGLATGQIGGRKVFLVLLREALVGLAIGLICGTIAAAIATVWAKPVLGLVVGLAMWGNMFTAATIGTLVPLIFKKLGVDPAVASAPFISTTSDVTGLLIYSTLTWTMLDYLR